MARYITPLIVNKLDSGKRYYETVVPETPKTENFPYQLEARMGDRWDTIAYKYLGSPALWYVVASANNSLNGSIFIKPGTIITIPGV